MPGDDFSSVVPAQLSYLTIYNPLLGSSDETTQDQIVFYTSKSARLRWREASAAGIDDDDESNSEHNEKLRQVGLAQGMVSFARNFSQGKPVDYIETDKANIVLHELERDWWILASVDLTRLPITDASNGSSSQRDASDISSAQYSSREMCPPQLLVQQLGRAHSIFLLHHDLTLDALYQRVGRSAFCSILDSFWRKFAWNWEVLLSGNPAVDMYNGIKLSAGGELGIGVGEEEWGSGEREVFEDFIVRTDGLVDLVVSRFGDPSEPNESPAATNKSGAADEDDTQWLGLDSHPRPSDGVVFSGVGALSRRSIARVSQWMEWIYRYGPDAYGVGDDPRSPRRRKRRKKPKGRSAKLNKEPDNLSDNASADTGFSPGIPRPLVTNQVPVSQQRDSETGSQVSSENSPAQSERGRDWIGFKPEAFVKYLTLGYGSAWGPSTGTPSPHPRVEALRQEDGSTGANKPTASPESSQQASDGEISRTEDTGKPKHSGKFLIGLHKDPATANTQPPEASNLANKSPMESEEAIVERTLNVHMASSRKNATADEQHPDSTKLRVVVYTHQPFIYTFLFDPGAPSLADPSLYQGISRQLSPLHKTLINSTSPANAAARISMSESAFDVNRRFTTKNQPVYDLVYDPSNLTVRTSIPNIPDLGVYLAETRDPNAAPWSRVESLNIHHRLLSTYVETRSRSLELERTCKTSRGWWVVWVRFPDSDRSNNSSSRSNNSDGDNDDDDDDDDDNAATREAQNTDGGDARQEAFVIRKASDHVPSASHGRSGSGSRFFRDLGGATSPGLASSRADTGPGKLVEGLGLDARRYIENLLSLNK